MNNSIESKFLFLLRIVKLCAYPKTEKKEYVLSRQLNNQKLTIKE